MTYKAQPDNKQWRLNIENGFGVGVGVSVTVCAWKWFLIEYQTINDHVILIHWLIKPLFSSIFGSSSKAIFPFRFKKYIFRFSPMKFE